MQSNPKELLKKNSELIHSEMQKVVSHVQRPSDDWIQHTVMIEGHDIPFKFKRKKRYKSLQGNRVNITYYPTTESIADEDMDVMNVVRIKIS